MPRTEQSDCRALNAELLAALRTMTELAVRQLNRGQSTPELIEKHPDIVAARAAIAKAERHQ